MARRKRKQRRYRRRARFGRIYGIISALLIVAAVLAGCVIFFRVSHVEISGNSYYTEEEILEASGIREGQNLYLINKFQVRDQLLTQLPYIQEVTIRRRLPDTITIQVTECSAGGAVESDGSWWVIGTDGKILAAAESGEGYTQVTGLTLLAPSPGTQMAVSEEDRLKMESLLELLQSLEENGVLDRADSVDLTSSSQLVLGYDGRFDVLIPLASDFSYKVRWMLEVVADNDSVKEGTIDMMMDDRVFLR